MHATSLRDTLAHRINERLFYGWVVLAVAALGLFASGPGSPLVLLHRTQGQVADLMRGEGIAFEPAPGEGFLHGARLRDDVAFLLTRTLRLVRFLRRRGARLVHTNDGRMHATGALPARLAGGRLLSPSGAQRRERPPIRAA
jgi:hypothetical protein